MQLVIMNSSQSVEREIENIYTLGRQKADAIILFGGVITDAHMAAIKKVNIPVIVLGQAVEGVHSLVHDEAHAGDVERTLNRNQTIYGRKLSRSLCQSRAGMF
ncbi:hypothetical protein BW721_06240 [Jeotgalibaca sp. PTS2502]|nr:hypothetical protein BW721_06240 [Jeotgalibaca sp. PTS2502]